jgi:hypothetical protein
MMEEATLAKLRAEKNMIEEIKQASAPPKLAHNYGVGKIELRPDAAVGDKLHESNYPSLSLLCFYRG